MKVIMTRIVKDIPDLAAASAGELLEHAAEQMTVRLPIGQNTVSHGIFVMAGMRSPRPEQSDVCKAVWGATLCPCGEYSLEWQE